MKYSFWGQVIALLVAASAFAYLVYALAWQGEDFRYLHVVTFLLIVALVLAPLAGRLKIWNLIDFQTKMESLREETKKELGDIRNQISTTIETRIAPVQHQWTVLGLGGADAKQLQQLITEAFQRATPPEIGEDISKAESPRIQFLRKADSYRHRAYTCLFMARAIQIAIRDQRSVKDGDIRTGSIDATINSILDHLLPDGVELFVPPDCMAETAEGLESIKNLLQLRQKVDSEEAEPPPQQESQELFRKVENSVANVLAGAAWQGIQAILYQQEMTRKLKYLRDSLKTEP